MDTNCQSFSVKYIVELQFTFAPFQFEFDQLNKVLSTAYISEYYHNGARFESKKKH